MKLAKKTLISIVVIMAFMSSMLLQTKSYATKTILPENEKHTYGIVELMTKNTPYMGYAINTPNDPNASFLWNIVRYKPKTSSSRDYDDVNMYCLKAAVGFVNSNGIEEGTVKSAYYNVFFNMKTDRSDISKQNKVLASLVEPTSTTDSDNNTFNRYDALLALADMLYLPGESTEAEKKELIYQLMINAGSDPIYNRFVGLIGKSFDLPANVDFNDFIYDGDPTSYNLTNFALTDNEITAIQQAAIWYFTNYYKVDETVSGDDYRELTEHETKYDKLNQNNWLNYKLEKGDGYSSLANYAPNGLNPNEDAGQARTYQAELLYKYLISQAKEKAHEYANIGEKSGTPVRIDTEEIGSTVSGENRIVGPFHLTQATPTPYTIGFVVKNNGAPVSYQLVNETSIPVGKDFYISVPKNQCTSLTVDITINYNEKDMLLWASTTNNQEQPLLEVKNQAKTESKRLSLEVPEEKKFDLALRKYITEINGTSLNELSIPSRNPQINASSLNQDGNTTAEYKHRKDPVTVEKGNIVTYNLTIYNEGEKAGRATKVVDQLPTGLKFKEVVSGNFNRESYNETTNTLTLVRKSTNSDNLNPYTSGNDLSSETITIKCEVTQEPDTQNTKVLTNVAWISAAVDEDGKQIVKTGDDRDSLPSEHPTEDKDHLADYKGNTENDNNLSNSNKHYKGQQDDDDFEKLQVLPVAPKKFDLALRKYITEINGTSLNELGIPSRNPQINASSLNQDGNTTAEYKHRKDPVTVGKGNIVTYNLSIYNEGEKAGRATKVVDQLPTGLKFKEVVSGNFDRESYNETTNTLTLVRKSTNSDNLNPYTSGNDLSSETITIKCEVTQEPDTQNTKVLTNVAWISAAVDEDGKQIVKTGDDRDSLPSEHPTEDKDHLADYKGNTENDNNLSNSDKHYKGQQDDDDFEKLQLLPVAPKGFDLALRKYITEINGKTLNELSIPSRNPQVDTSKLNQDGNTTAEYKHRKDPVTIKQNDIVTYNLSIYNEGEKAGRATKVVDQLPTGLKFKEVVSGNFDRESYNETTNTLTLVRKSTNSNNLNPYTTGNDLSSETITIKCEVIEEPDKQNVKILTNVAWIAAAVDEDGKQIVNTGDDRDSLPSEHPTENKDNLADYKGNTANDNDLAKSNMHYKGEQDDDDFEKLKLLPEAFDLKLIKFITAINDNEQMVPNRINKIDVSKLNKVDEQGNMSTTTADYDLNKVPVPVKKGDIVTYTFRIYNEGTIDGYASEITEDIPEGLQFLGSLVGEDMKPITDEDELAAIDFNAANGWSYVEGDTTKIKTTALALHPIVNNVPDAVSHTENLIKAFGKNDGTKTEDDISYKEISVKFKVVSDEIGVAIKNEAAITEDSNKDGKPVDDRDSHTDDWKEHPNHEDDEDHDYIILQSFDLALRKFIVAVSNDTKIDNNEYLKNEDGSYKRAPSVDTSKLNTLNEKNELITTATYNHTKEPVVVEPNSIVVYMLRVYNEGEQNGYAAEIKDHLPSYLEFVEGEFNEQYGWEKSEDGKTVTTRYLENSLIRKAEESADGKIVLSYQEVPIMCKVKANAKSNEKITNIADITEYQNEQKQPVVDRDSQQNNVKVPTDKKLPTYKDDEKGLYVPGQQDDDDFEKIMVKTFDLALRKWVTQAIVIEDGKETVKQTGHDAWDDPESVVKVELNRKKLNQVTVKFKYSIRVYNQGEIAGYAKEVTDYVPDGLKFVAEDNPGWTEKANNIITTKLTENILLQPGEYTDVEVMLTWVNNENNMGVMNNVAEISADDNEYDVPDIDSTPNNKQKGEDDIDDAPVMLSITTGQVRIYFTLGFIVLLTSAGGIVLIKKFVL